MVIAGGVLAAIGWVVKGEVDDHRIGAWGDWDWIVLQAQRASHCRGHIRIRQRTDLRRVDSTFRPELRDVGLQEHAGVSGGSGGE